MRSQPSGGALRPSLRIETDPRHHAARTLLLNLRSSIKPGPMYAGPAASFCDTYDNTHDGHIKPQCCQADELCFEDEGCCEFSTPLRLLPHSFAEASPTVRSISSRHVMMSMRCERRA